MLKKNSYPKVFMAVALLMLAILPVRPAFAAPSFTVNSILDEVDDNPGDGICHTANNTCTLRAAIMEANRASGVGATIMLPAGTYTLTIPAAGADGDDNGDLNLTTPASGNPVITITGAGASTTIIDANQIDRVFSIAARAAIISSVTIRNGFTIGRGGGILNQGSLTLNDSTLSGNSALDGGGIENFGGLTVSNSTLNLNNARFGGGIDNIAGNLTVSNSTFILNNAYGGGGGISNSGGALTVSSSTFSQNIGGGMQNSSGSLTVSSSTLSGNSATSGGGIANINAGTLAVSNSTLHSNSAASDGAGIYNAARLVVVNSTISGNSAYNNGGGIYNTLGNYAQIGAAANVYNTSIVFNGADADADPNGGSGGGVFNNDATGAIFNLRNTLVAGNTVSGAPVADDCVGTLHSYGRNLFGDTSGCTVVTNSGSWTTLNSLDFLGPLQNNGGPTWTVALLPGSNAIDGGDPAGCTDYNGNPLPTDQRGVTRPQGTFCDIGAYEFLPDNTPPSVSSITRVNASPTAADSVDFTVSFSEPVTGVDASDFTLTTSGVSGAAVSGVGGSGSVYTVTVSTGSGNGSIRLDLVNDSSIKDLALNPLGAGFTSGEIYTVSKSAIFADVPSSYWANTFIERLYNAGITGGCSLSPLMYCPETNVNRAQMAVFLLRGEHGSAYVPPAVESGTGFTDVPADYWAAAWIKQLAAEGITSGCGPSLYCPETSVTRDQMAVFLLRAKYGTSYAPPSATGVFADVPTTHWAAPWIEQLAAEGITGGCGVDTYCPSTPVTRAQMAVFLVRTFNLP